MLNVGILTISDKGSQGLRQDRSGEVIKENLPRMTGHAAAYAVVPDEKEIIAAKLREWADSGKIDVIFSTGGTGLGARDVTPEATRLVIEKEVPGIAEAMRQQTLGKTPLAMLSRAIAGVRGKCLIINLPGSPKAVQECLEVILPAVPHAVAILKGEITEHAPAETGRK